MPSSSKNPLRGAVEIIPNRLYYCALDAPLQNHKILIRNPFLNTTNPDQKFPVVCFNIDDELVYWNFFLDFGPLNLGQLHRFTTRLNGLLANARKDNTTILFYSSTLNHKRANAIFLACAWQVLELNRTPEAAYRGFSSNAYPKNRTKSGDGKSTLRTNKVVYGNVDPSIGSSNPPLLPLTSIGRQTIEGLPPFHDASPYRCTYELTLMDCLGALVKARQFDFFDWGDKFNVAEYEHFEQVENGDLNWIVKGKILAFAGPSYRRTVSPEGYCTLSPSDYIPYFKRKNVGLVVRLNQKNYNEQNFIDVGIDHVEEFYTDGSCPHMSILERVVAAFDKVPPEKGFAVHCKAGLGRTGTCIGAYLMKHYRMTAKEVIGWMRICRPGMVIGPQQQFLEKIQRTMWREGDAMRSVAAAAAAAEKASSMPLPMQQQTYSETGNPQVVPMSPSSKSISTTATAPETPESVILATVGSKEAGHEVILTGGRTLPNSSNDSFEYYNDVESPTFDLEEAKGRPGQADGLLAARHSRQTPSSTSSSPSPMMLSSSSTSTSSPQFPMQADGGNNSDEENIDKSHGTNKPTSPAVPVTPDNRGTAPSALWTSAFA